MKKILSIFSIGVILGSGTILTGGGIACGSNTPNPPGPTPNPPTPPKPPTKQLDLSTITLPDINVTKQGTNILVNGQSAYDSIRDAIIAGYNGFFPNKDPLTQGNFTYGTKTVTKDKPWALELSVSVRGKSSYTNLLIKPTEETNLHVNHDQNLLQNDLILDISTNNENVKQGSGDNLSVYLNQFVFNNSDANNNNDLVLNTNDPQPEFTPESTINLKTGPKALTLNFNGSTTATRLLTQIENSANALKLTNDVIDNLNNAYDQHILDNHLQTLIPKLSELKNNASPYLLKNPAGGNQILWIYVRQTFDQTNHAFAQREGDSELCFPNQKVDVYLKIEIGNWEYLSGKGNKFITPADTCVYAYLGQATKTTS